MMITLEQWMKLVDYKVTESSYYGWTCYGPNAYIFESWSGSQDGYSMTIVFDTKSHVTYEITAYDLKRNKAYRMLNKETIDLYKAECVKRNVPFSEAWDDVEYTDLEVTDDFLEKARAIMAGEEYDTRIQLELNLSEADKLALFDLAHARDCSLNQLIDQILREVCAEQSKKSLTTDAVSYTMAA